MGFYAPAQIVRDARLHGVEVRPVCINGSEWDCTLEPADGRYFAMRLGLRMAKGLSEGHAARLTAHRRALAYRDVEYAWRRAAVTFPYRTKWPAPTHSTVSALLPDRAVGNPGRGRDGVGADDRDWFAASVGAVTGAAGGDPAYAGWR